MSPGWARLLVVGGLLVAGHALLPETVTRGVVYIAIASAAVAALVVAVRRQRDARRTPWYLMAAGLGSWVIGDAIWAYYDHVAQVDPFPSVADVFYLAAYPLIAVGLYSLASPRRRTVDHMLFVDALIVAVGAGLVLWVVFIDPAWRDPAGTTVERVVSTLYPVADVVLLTQLAHMGASPVMRTPSLRLLVLGVLAMLGADTTFQVVGYLPGDFTTLVSYLDSLYLAAYLLWAAAAVHPSMPAAGEARTAPDRTFTHGRIVFLALSVLPLPLVALVEHSAGVRIHVMEISAAAVILIALILVRMSDMVARMRDQAARLAHLADTDFLTGLDNRRRFVERVEAAFAAPRGTSTTPALLLLGLERFTEINDTLGHRTGDELLRAVATRLRTSVGAGVAVCRMGGDVFGLLINPASDAAPGESALVQGHAVRALLAEPFVLSDVSVAVDGAVGVVVAPADAHDADAMFHRADVALSVAREADGRVARYHADMETGGALAPSLIAELRSALEDDQIVVHFQPQIEVTSGRVLGVEALVRWQHPEHGLLGPMHFIPAAERTGLIRLLTLYVLDRALEQCAVWRAQGHDLTVAVNLSVRNLLDPGLVTDVRDALARHHIEPSRLELEITETMAMVDPTRSVEVLGALDALGVTLSVDDYGTGYGSLAYLQRLPVRRLKIDRSFVGGVLDDPASAAIVRSTIELARHLGLSVVAEGVENDLTLLSLRDMHCFAAQGFGIGRPVPAAEVPPLIDAIHARVPALVRPERSFSSPSRAGMASAGALVPGPVGASEV